jgi:protein-disulfide isomerase
MLTKSKTWLLVVSLLAILALGYNIFSDNTTIAKPMNIEDASTEFSTIDVAKALEKRSIGNKDAPVKIEEYASLSCNHCASFHKETFKVLKEKYIDTGIVHFTFNDFPLDAAALDASMVARCLPEESYFKFIGFLFDTQEKWARERNYRQILEQNSKLLGLDQKTFEDCLDNESLKHGLVAGVQQAQTDHNIRSTPSFVINGERVISGNQSIQRFSKIIDEILEKNNNAESTE